MDRHRWWRCNVEHEGVAVEYKQARAPRPVSIRSLPSLWRGRSASELRAMKITVALPTDASTQLVEQANARRMKWSVYAAQLIIGALTEDRETFALMDKVNAAIERKAKPKAKKA